MLISSPRPRLAVLSSAIFTAAARGAAVVVERVAGHVHRLAADVGHLDELGGATNRVVHPLGDDDLLST
jgi:hypothetical protein